MASIVRRAGTDLLKLFKQAADPANAANFGMLYAKAVSGVTQLFGLDDAGTAYQLTGLVGTALSVFGVTGNANAARADLVAGSDGDVLRRSGTTLAFGSIGQTSVSGVGSLGTGIYGSGRDSAATDAANRTLNQVFNYTNWNINGTAVINPDRFLMVGSGTLTIAAGAKISQNGVAGSGSAGGGTGGGAGGAGNLGVGSAGGNGGNNVGGSPGGTSTNQPFDIGTTCKGGAGGISSASLAGGLGGTLTSVTAVTGSPYLAWPLLGFYPYATGTAVSGGSGGGGGSATGTSVGGKGGGGGGVIGLIFNTIVNNGSIEALGGDGSAAVSSGAGGGGGGGGGKVFIITRAAITGSGAISVAPGNGGSGLGGGGTGNPGNTGLSLTLIV